MTITHTHIYIPPPVFMQPLYVFKLSWTMKSKRIQNQLSLWSARWPLRIWIEDILLEKITASRAWHHLRSNLPKKAFPRWPVRCYTRGSVDTSSHKRAQRGVLKRSKSARTKTWSDQCAFDGERTIAVTASIVTSREIVQFRFEETTAAG